MNVNAEKKTPSRGTASDVVGVISDKIVRKKQTERRMVVSEIRSISVSGNRKKLTQSDFLT